MFITRGSEFATCSDFKQTQKSVSVDISKRVATAQLFVSKGLAFICEPFFMPDDDPVHGGGAKRGCFWYTRSLIRYVVRKDE